MADSVNLAIDLAPEKPGGLRLPSPVLIASGTFGYDGYGRGIAPDAPLHQLGAVLPKTVTRHPRAGNPEPRWFPESFREGLAAGETTLLNSIGLTNPGIEDAMRVLAPQWAAMDANIVMSMAAASPEQWEEMAAFTKGVSGFAAIELNLSCPNVDDGAMFSHHPRLTEAAVAGVRRQTELPLWAKLSPNVPDIAEIAQAAVAAGADALTLPNSPRLQPRLLPYAIYQRGRGPAGRRTPTHQRSPRASAGSSAPAYAGHRRAQAPAKPGWKPGKRTSPPSSCPWTPKR